ncbi:response regulator transcription factor [Oscillochloris sp. ZM17-4]|uniref:response regulator transcription factor n=1 Tax=Oscillochloris sp. ZM17-4 TaxID=2866714 RepID=UPI001C738692|nr:response regulator transcription factor [Oscillochloris sp. ZM17-4]MBX0331096.1 response regulator transcription factor [Oscillochloris sp. ZM17-4]
MGERILVVDDEPQMGRLLKTGLSARGYEVAVAVDGEEALDQAVRWKPDVIVLDLGLPLIDGLEVCRRIRGWSQVPIIVLSARDGEQDKVEALDLGADDYLIKPFGMDELLARIRVALRHSTRASVTEEPVLTFGELRIDRPRRIVTLKGQDIHLTPTEYELLRLLSSHAGKVLTHRTILRAIWGTSYEQDLPTLRVFITQLRRKIEPDPAQPTFILTEPGIGYRFQM